jgi:hypothetical protein
MLRFFLSGFQMGYDIMGLGGCMPAGYYLEYSDIIYIGQADRAYGTEISPALFVISFVILLYAISYNICIQLFVIM